MRYLYGLYQKNNQRSNHTYDFFSIIMKYCCSFKEKREWSVDAREGETSTTHSQLQINSRKYGNRLLEFIPKKA